eukprot:SAG31_NODE_30219_length_384_cov_0.680702_1_plen_66_part_10
MIDTSIKNISQRITMDIAVALNHSSSNVSTARGLSAVNVSSDDLDQMIRAMTALVDSAAPSTNIST